MSQKNPTPFDNILGYYGFPPAVCFNRLSKKSFMFIGDRWQEIGDIIFLFIQVNEDSGFMEIHPPDPNKYAADHENEGALDWFKWGPRVN